MKRIYKYTLEQVTRVGMTTEMPAGAEVLSVQPQGNKWVAWALVDVEAPMVARNFYAYFTGASVPEGIPALVHRGTVQLDGLVYHLFEDPREYRREA